VVRAFLRSEGPAALLATLVAGAGILVLGTLLGWWRSEPSVPSGRALVVLSASLAPQTVQFGDPVAASVELLAGNSVDPAQLGVRASFAPYEVTGPVERSQRRVGSSSSLVLRYHLTCLQASCLPPPGRSFSFPQARVVDAGGRTLVRFGWPSLIVGSHLTTGDLTRSSPPWRAPVNPLPAPGYRISPTLAYALLVALGSLALLAAVLLAAAALGIDPRTVIRERRRRSPLEEAVLLTRRAAGGAEVEARRRALERLGTELRRSNRGELANDAVSLAWSEPRPSSEEMLTLAGRAEEDGS
jgi:hypothetical protein